MNEKETAIKLWMDESTEVNGQYILVGYLITDCYEKEYDFFKSLTQKRHKTKCFTTLHGSDIDKSDSKKIELFDEWLGVFNENVFEKGIYFHVFLYKKDEKKISKNKNFEHYFAKQSVFALAQKMKGSDLFDKHVANMFKDVKTVIILADNRGDYSAEIIPKDQGGNTISKIHQLEDIYLKEIVEQFEKQTGKSTKTNDLTVRFSFVSDECFDGVQFSDTLLYAIRQKLEGNNEHHLAKVFDKHFLNTDEDVKELGIKEIYKWDKKFNFFESVK